MFFNVPVVTWWSLLKPSDDETEALYALMQEKIVQASVVGPHEAGCICMRCFRPGGTGRLLLNIEKN